MDCSICKQPKLNSPGSIDIRFSLVRSDASGPGTFVQAEKSDDELGTLLRPIIRSNDPCSIFQDDSRRFCSAAKDAS
jgi:hypothetical protein